VAGAGASRSQGGASARVASDKPLSAYLPLLSLSIAIYTQLSDVELELCNGFYTFNRVPKLNTSQRAHVAALTREFWYTA